MFWNGIVTKDKKFQWHLMPVYWHFIIQVLLEFDFIKYASINKPGGAILVEMIFLIFYGFTF